MKRRSVVKKHETDLYLTMDGFTEIDPHKALSFTDSYAAMRHVNDYCGGYHGDMTFVEYEVGA